MSVTSAPIGSTGQSLDGFAVNANVLAAFRESVVITDPNNSTGAAPVSSTTGLSVNVASSVSLAIAGTSQVFGTVSTQVVSSIPFYVSQSSAPWSISGQVSTFPTGQISTWIANAPNVNVTNVPQVNITTSIPFFVTQSSAPWAVNGTTTPNIISSIPLNVAQSSAPWVVVDTATTAGGLSATTIALAATLNTTVIKAGAGQVYGVYGSNVGSSQVFVRLYNFSTAALTIASTGVPLLNIGLPISTSPYFFTDLGVAFSSGITLLTQQQPYTASTSVAPTASTATITITYK